MQCLLAWCSTYSKVQCRWGGYSVVNQHSVIWHGLLENNALDLVNIWQLVLIRSDLHKIHTALGSSRPTPPPPPTTWPTAYHNTLKPSVVCLIIVQHIRNTASVSQLNQYNRYNLVLLCSFITGQCHAGVCRSILSAAHTRVTYTTLMWINSGKCSADTQKITPKLMMAFFYYRTTDKNNLLKKNLTLRFFRKKKITL